MQTGCGIAYERIRALETQLNYASTFAESSRNPKSKNFTHSLALPFEQVLATEVIQQIIEQEQVRYRRRLTYLNLPTRIPRLSVRSGVFEFDGWASLGKVFAGADDLHSGCDAVGLAVTSAGRGQEFEQRGQPSHRKR